MGEIPFESWVQTLVALGLDDACISALESVLGRDAGLVVFAGPTGMGKTTLASLCAAAFSVRHVVGDLRSEADMRSALQLARQDLARISHTV